MEYRFQFTLKKQEYLDFLKAQSMLLRKNRRKKLWIVTSIPTLILCSVIFFGLYTSILWVMAAVMAAGVWIMEIGPRLWSRHLDRRFSEKLLEEMEINRFEPVELIFDEEKITACFLGKKRRLFYKSLRTFLPLGGVFAFSDGQKETYLLPCRVFPGKEEMETFLKDFKIARISG